MIHLFRTPFAFTACLCALAIVSINFAAPNAAHASVVTDNPAAWQLTFNDDFTGTSLDSTKWAHRLPGVRHDAINTPNAVAVANGLLTITTYTSEGTHYTGMLGTQNLFEQAFGYYEARMKFNSSPGQWSAFWMTSPTYGNPIGDPGAAGTEIDIVEHRDVNNNNVGVRGRYVSAVHWDGYGDEHQQVARTHSGLTGMGNNTWHTYGLKWSPAGYEFYYDDQLIWTVTQAVSLRPEYMILSSEVRDAKWAGTIPAGGYGSLATSATNMQVDWVRVYAGIPGDFNSDGNVDALDYVVWRSGSTTGTYNEWRENYGYSNPSAATGARAAVPEPTAALLLFVAAAVGSFIRARNINAARSA